MKRFLLLLAFGLFAAAPAYAALKAGDIAPEISVPASLAGKQFHFSLNDALKKGPVVVYFYPAAFTTGCTIEAHEFAANMDRFKALGASVVGVSRDSIATLDKFSVSECQSKFPVASDLSGAVTNAYDARLNDEHSDRISYVIVPGANGQGKILYQYRSLDPDLHVDNTIAAIEGWKKDTK